MAKVLCIGDPHIRVSNIQDVDLFMERLESRVLSQQNFDAIVVLGDTLHDHERLHTTPLNKAIEFFVMLSRHARLWVLVGNHDLQNNQQFLTENHWLVAVKSLPNITVVDTAIFSAELNAVFMPYVPNGRMAEAISTNPEIDLDTVSAVFAHQEIQGCVMGAFVSEHGDVYLEDNPPLVSGHIHSNQQPQPNVYYPGSMLQHAFGESTRNVVAIVTVPENVDSTEILVGSPAENQVSVEEIDLELPRKITLYVDAAEFNSIVSQVPDEASHTRIVVEGTADEFKAIRRKKVFKTLRNRGAKIVFKSRVLNTADTEPEKTTDDFVSVLQGMCSGSDSLAAFCDEILQETLQSQ